MNEPHRYIGPFLHSKVSQGGCRLYRFRITISFYTPASSCKGLLLAVTQRDAVLRLTEASNIDPPKQDFLIGAVLRGNPLILVLHRHFLHLCADVHEIRTAQPVHCLTCMSALPIDNGISLFTSSPRSLYQNSLVSECTKVSKHAGMQVSYKLTPSSVQSLTPAKKKVSLTPWALPPFLLETNKQRQ